jgi:hypothetical protein
MNSWDSFNIYAEIKKKALATVGLGEIDKRKQKIGGWKQKIVN